MMQTAHALALLLVWVLPGPALAGSYQTEGATIRLVAEPPDRAGRIRGAILFELEPGWKTYWLDPGESGLSPRLDFSGSDGIAAPNLSFPAPRRLIAEGETLNGYDEPMAIAFETTGRADARIVLDLSAGLCRTLCVPVSATLDRDLSEPLALTDAAAIDRAFLALPTPASGATTGRIEGETLVVDAPAGSGEAPDLFVSGPPGWRFGAPLGGKGPPWRVPIRERPGAASAPGEPLLGVFVDGDEATALTIELR